MRRRRLLVEPLESRRLLAGGLLVRFQPQATDQDLYPPGLEAAVVHASSQLVDGLRFISLPDEISLDTALQAYRSSPAVIYAEPDAPLTFPDGDLRARQSPLARDAETPALPDLLVLSAEAVTDHVIAAAAEIEFTVYNLGDQSSGSFDVDVVWSDDSIIGNDDDVVIETVTIDDLAGGGLRDEALTVALDRPRLFDRATDADPPGMPVGARSEERDYLAVIVDPTDQVAESNEDNNQGIPDDVAYFPWDIDSSGEVTTTDVIYVINRMGGTDPTADLDGSGTVSPTDAVSAINRLGHVMHESVVETQFVPNDPLFPLQWPLRNRGQTGGTPGVDIGAIDAWGYTTGDPTVIVAVIDSGADFAHSDLAEKLLPGWDFLEGDDHPQDFRTHGTGVSGTIAAVADNGTDLAGIAPGVSILPLRIDENLTNASTSRAIEAIEFALEQGARIANLSFITAYSQGLYDTMRAAGELGMVFATAAGNQARDNDRVGTYPASFNLNNIIAVASVDHNGELSSFSNYGATRVDLAAPGEDVRSLKLGGGTHVGSGTSTATAHVTGVLALLRSLQPDWSPEHLRSVLLATVTPHASLSETVSGGMLNAYQALRIAAGADEAGPTVIDARGEADRFNPRIRLGFSEAIAAESFTLDDVTVSGPGGTPVDVVGLQRLGVDEYHVTFTNAGTGDYTLSLRPSVSDLSFNALDQDGDGLGGEHHEDRFTTTVPIAARNLALDFSHVTSPPGEGYTPVFAENLYNSQQGYGWAWGDAISTDRGLPDPLLRDFHYGTDGMFVVNVPDGEHTVRVTLGDYYFPHFGQQIRVGNVGEVVDTAAGEFVELEYPVVSAGGQIQLRLTSMLEGFFVLNALEVELGPVLTLEIDVDEVSEDPASPTATATVYRGGQTEGDVEVFLVGSDPDQLDLPPSVVIPDGSNRVSFPVAALDDERVEFSREVVVTAAAAGHTTGRDTLLVRDNEVPLFFAQYDFGTEASPVEPGWTQVTEAATYDPASGFGWLGEPPSSLDRESPEADALLRDFNYVTDSLLSVDVPNGEYVVRLWLGDSDQEHRAQLVYLESELVDIVNTPPGTFLVREYEVDVQDWQLNLGFVADDDDFVVTPALEILSRTKYTPQPEIQASFSPDAVDEGPGQTTTLTVSRHNTDTDVEFDVTLAPNIQGELVLPASVTFPAGVESVSGASSGHR